MRVFENTPEKQPQNFYMGRETGELRDVLDDVGGEIGTEPVIAYDVQVRQDITAEGIYYTRRCAKGVRRIHLTPFSAALSCGVDEDNLLPVMTQIMIQEVSEDGGVTWTIPAVTERIVDADADGLIDFLLSTGPGSYCRIDTVDNYFLAGTGKQTYEISAPGKLTRLQLVVTIHDPMEAVLDLSDFDGPVEHVLSVNEAGEDVITYTFYPDGIEYAVIDPYLTVEEPAGYIEITCDGYLAKFYLPRSTNNTNLADFINSVGTVFFSWKTSAYDGGHVSFLYDSNCSVSILENSSNRVVLQYRGSVVFYTTEALWTTALSDVILLVFVYPDRIFASMTFSSNNETASSNFQVMEGGGTLTNAISISTDNTVEVVPPAYSIRDAYKYLGFVSDEANVTVSIPKFNDPGLCDFFYRVWSAPYNFRAPLGTFFPTGVSSIGVLFLIDSIERSDIPNKPAWATATSYSVGDLVSEAGIGYECMTAHTSGTFTTDFASGYWHQCHKYTSADRLTIGTQYHDILNNLNLPSVTTGTAVTDLHLPDHIDEGICADGAQHIDMTDNAAKVTLNQSSINQPLVLHDPSITTGTVGSETEHCIGFWKCDDSAGTNLVIATVGSTASWLDNAGNPRNTNLDSVAGVYRNRALDCGDDVGFLSIPIGGLTNAFFNKGSVVIKALPQFLYSDDNDQFIFELYIDSINYIRLLYNSALDEYMLNTYCGGVQVMAYSSTYTDSGMLNAPTVFTISWDFDSDWAVARLNGMEELKTINTGIPTGDPVNLYIGNRVNENRRGNYIIDEVKIYDVPILPYGSFLPGNLTDYSKAHSDITAHVLGDTLRIGGGTLSSIGTPASVTGQDGNSVSGRSYSDGNYDYFPADGLPTAKGSVSFWYKNESAIPLYARLFTTGGIYKVFHLEFQSNNTDEVNFLIGDVSGRIIVPGATLLDGNWHFISLFWDVQSDTRGVSINGGDVVLNTTPITTPDFTGLNFNVGNDPDSTSKSCNGIIYGLTITNSPNTPQVPFIPGHGPVHSPLMSKNGTLARPGTDYQIAWVD